MLVIAPPPSFPAFPRARFGLYRAISAITPNRNYRLNARRVTEVDVIASRAAHFPTCRFRAAASLRYWPLCGTRECKCVLRPLVAAASPKIGRPLSFSLLRRSCVEGRDTGGTRPSLMNQPTPRGDSDKQDSAGTGRDRLARGIRTVNPGFYSPGIEVYSVLSPGRGRMRRRAPSRTCALSYVQPSRGKTFAYLHFFVRLVARRGGNNKGEARGGWGGERRAVPSPSQFDALSLVHRPFVDRGRFLLPSPSSRGASPSSRNCARFILVYLPLPVPRGY